MNINKLHEKTWEALQQRRSRLPHALLLIGQKGLGKFALAKDFAASLLCEQPLESGEACRACLACNWFTQGNHPDFRLLQPEALAADTELEEGKKKPSQQITIDQIRQLEEFFNVGTHRGGLRIIVVNPTEAMNRNAANALLKTLEEPAPSTLFILISSEPQQLLPTIRSRCQLIPVGVPDTTQASAYLADAGVADASRWLAMAGGSPRLAIEMARGKQGSWLENLQLRLLAGKSNDPLLAATEMEKLLKESKGQLQLKQLVEAIQKWVVDLTLTKHGLQIRYFLGQENKISALADMIPATRLIQAYRALIIRRQESEQPVNARLFLESLFFDYRALFANR